MQRMLVAVDGSEHSLRAIDMAADIGVHYDIPLVVIHVRSDSGVGQIPSTLSHISNSRTFMRPNLASWTPWPGESPRTLPRGRGGPALPPWRS